MDIYVMPSLTETNSLATMEAMACGVPVISTPVGFLKDYIRHGYNGYFFPRRDSYALSKRLSELLGNPQVRKAMSENARRTIVERFSWDRTAEELMQAINLYDVAKQEEPAQQQ